MFSRIWGGLAGITFLGLLWLSGPYLVGAYYLDRGAALMAEGDNQAAVGYLEIALHFEPDNEQTYRKLAKAYLQLDKPKQALAAAQQALSLSPNNPLLLLELGDAYDDLGNVEQAIAHYQAGLIGDRQPQLAVNYLKLAEQLWLKNDREAAVSIWRDKLLGQNDYADLYAKWRLYQYYAHNVEQADFYRNQAKHFPEESFLPTAEPRLASYQIEAIAGALRDDLWATATKRGVLAYYAWYNDLQPTEFWLQRLIEAAPEEAELWYYLGEYYRRQGQSPQAENAYKQTIALAPDYARAYLRLGMLNEARFKNGENQQWLRQAQTWYQQYRQLAPEDPLSLKKLADGCELSQCSENIWLAQLKEELAHREPEFPVGGYYTQINDWQLLGYDANEAMLVGGEPTALWLYWWAPANGVPITDEANFYHIGERWAQVIEEARNLVPNGGFELGRTPFGFPEDIYDISAQTRTFVAERRYGQDTRAALLNNVGEMDHTSFVTNYFPVNPQHVYLQAAWAKGKEGTGFLGWRWLGNLKRGQQVYDYYNLIREPNEPAHWVHHAHLMKPAQGATAAQVWLLNAGVENQFYFDNVLLVDIGQFGPAE
ncbi:MAG: tetratricopeptide repeat protein [Anaerolineae bacterium]|nr:tetratricopeptide repeat protein [Anaerolineae bacterium]